MSVWHVTLTVVDDAEPDVAYGYEVHYANQEVDSAVEAINRAIGDVSEHHRVVGLDRVVREHGPNIRPVGGEP